MPQQPQRNIDIKTVRQPKSGQLADVLIAALSDARFTSLRAAVAYVTTSGVHQLADAIGESNIAGKWLTSFDWCRSDPAALGALNSATRHNVRVQAGAAVAQRLGCSPSTPFHPKCFLFTGPESALLVSGSGNLSASGLRRGIEFGTVIALDHSIGRRRQPAPAQAVADAKSWFDALWRSADAYEPLAGAYEAQFERRPPSSAALDFGDPPEPGAGRFSAEQLAQISRAPTMWIQAGRLTASTSANPGHQLMMRPYTRVFFGIAASRVPEKSHLGDVLMSFGASGPVSRPIEFAHNSMDRLNLPTSDGERPARYDRETLVLSKRPHRGRVLYEVELAAPTEKRKLRSRSERLGLAFKMSGSGREFGFF